MIKNKNFAVQFVEAAAGQVIEGALVDERNELDADEDKLSPIAPMSWEDAEPILAKYPNDEHSAVRAYAWTQSWVLFTYEYDSSFAVHRVPRNPADGVPYFCGYPCWQDEESNG